MVGGGGVMVKLEPVGQWDRLGSAVKNGQGSEVQIFKLFFYELYN